MGDEPNKEIVNKIMQDPSMLAALQYNLNKFVGTPSGYISSLPPSVKRRIKALKNLQLEYTNIEVEFFNEVSALELKYHKKHIPLYEKRNAIISGEHEPTDEEATFDLDDEEEEETTPKEEEKKESEEPKEDPKGVPEFWLTIFKNVDLLMEMVQDYDEPILAKLRDIKLVLPEDKLGFTLEFHFDENEYFTNKMLTKEYEMTCKPAKNDPFSFEGPEINSCKGCTIDWKKGKNVTVKTIKKKQVHKSKGSVRTVTKTVANDSFFNFFNPPEVPEDVQDVEEETKTLLLADYEIGHYIRERLIPRAVLFFTGEALEDEDYEEEDEGEMDEDELDEDEDEEEKDPDYVPSTDKTGQDPNQCPNQ